MKDTVDTVELEVDERPRKERRQRNKLKHSRRGPQQMNGKAISMGYGYDRKVSDPMLVLWHTTKPRPWSVKATNRRRNKAARATRKAHR